jgi:hypothetical protein
MTKQNAKEFLPLVQALADGKTLQMLSDNDGWVDINSAEFFYSPSSYRVKPEPKLRPWLPHEVPVGALIRFKGATSRSLIIASDYTNPIQASACYNTDFALSRFEHSLDYGKTWLPCGVMEDAA